MLEIYRNKGEDNIPQDYLEKLQITRTEGVQKTYLVVKERQDEKPNYQMQMLCHNQLPGMLRMELRCIDNEYFYYYEITEFITLKEYFALNRLECRMAMSILSGMIRTIEAGREYLLTREHYIIDAEYIFWDRKKEVPVFFYQSGYKKGMQGQLIALLEYMMDIIDHKDKKTVRFIYGLYKKLQGKEDVLNETEEYLEYFEIEEMQIEEISRKEIVAEHRKKTEGNIEKNEKGEFPLRKTEPETSGKEGAMEEDEQLASMLQKKYEKQQLALLFLIGSSMIFLFLFFYLS